MALATRYQGVKKLGRALNTMILKILINDIRQFSDSIVVLFFLVITCFMYNRMGAPILGSSDASLLLEIAWPFFMSLLGLLLSIDIMYADELLGVNAFWKAKPIKATHVIISKLLFLLLIISPVPMFLHWIGFVWFYLSPLTLIASVLFAVFSNHRNTAIVCAFVFAAVSPLLEDYIMRLF